MNLKNWNLLTTNRLAELTSPDQLAAFAMAYLESAEILCLHLAQEYSSATYEKGSAVLYLAQHAIELFLKGAIARIKPDEKFSHGVESIYQRYKNLYPAKRFHFDLGFTTNYQGFSKKEIQQIRKSVPPIDQLFRYPFNKEGQPWPGLYAFEANSFCIELAEIRTSFNRLLNEYEI